MISNELDQEFADDIDQQPDEDTKLEIEEEYPGCINVYFKDAYSDGQRVALCRLDETKDLVTIYPIVTWRGKHDFLGPKYDELKSIELDGFGFSLPDPYERIADTFLELPPGFVKDYKYGLGLKKEFRSIVESLEKAGVKHLVLSRRIAEASIEGDLYVLPYAQFDALRRAINRITEKYRSEASVDRRILSHNTLLATLDSTRYPEQARPYKAGTIYKLIEVTRELDTNLSRSDKSSIVEIIRRNATDIIKADSAQLLALKTDIEIATLEQLVAKFEAMIDSNLSEEHWQSFFKSNPFILTLAFGYPIIVIADQVIVGGAKISGSGQKIADFLAQSEATGNAAIIEIKKPSSQLLQKSLYRPGLYAPSTALTGAVSQCLDQRHQLHKEISRIKDESDLPSLQAYAVHCILVAGKTPTDKSSKKSFELLRNSIHGVQVITFDELLSRLRTLRNLLVEARSEVAPVA